MKRKVIEVAKEHRMAGLVGAFVASLVLGLAAAMNPSQANAPGGGSVSDRVKTLEVRTSALEQMAVRDSVWKAKMERIVCAPLSINDQYRLGCPKP